MPLLTTLMKTCATLSQKVAESLKDRNFQALEILQLKKRVKRLERKKKSKTSGLKRPRKGEKIAAIDANEGTTLVDAKTDEEEVSLDAESQGRINLNIKVHLVKENVNAARKGVSAVIAPKLVSTAEPTVFDNEDVTMAMSQTLIKLKAEKARILDEKIAQKLHEEEVRKVAARDEQEKLI
nr:hypothetical protein [Tanacetum cinerariifolium]